MLKQRLEWLQWTRVIDCRDTTIKIMTARDAKNHFGVVLGTVRREPVVVSNKDSPVGTMISMKDAAETVLPEMLLDTEAGYDGWLFDKVSTTLTRVGAGDAKLHTHDDAMALLRERVKNRAQRKG